MSIGSRDPERDNGLIHFAIDRGGTFTDVYASVCDGTSHHVMPIRMLSTQGCYEIAFILNRCALTMVVVVHACVM